MIRSFCCLCFVFSLNLSYSDSFECDQKELLKNILIQDMYKEENDCLQIDGRIGEIFTDLLNTKNGRSLLNRITTA